MILTAIFMCLPKAMESLHLECSRLGLAFLFLPCGFFSLWVVKESLTYFFLAPVRCLRGFHVSLWSSDLHCRGSSTACFGEVLEAGWSLWGSQDSAASWDLCLADVHFFFLVSIFCLMGALFWLWGAYLAALLRLTVPSDKVQVAKCILCILKLKE